MRLMKYLRGNKTTAQVAKDRLHIIIAQERSEKDGQDYLPLMRKEILDVIAKYTQVNLEQVKVDFHTDNNNSVLELNVVLPEKMAEAEAS